MKGLIEKIETAARIFLRIAQFSGSDAKGNRYYESRNIFTGTPKRPRRWVIYAHGTPQGTQEAFIPPQWHGWMHHYASLPLPAKTLAKKRSPKSMMRPVDRKVEKFLYEPWKPR